MSRWEPRWARVQDVLPEIDWPNFRRTVTPTIGVEGLPQEVPRYIEMCRRFGVPEEFWGDTLVGNPEAVGGYTVKSLQHAFHAHRIATKWRASHPVRVLEIGGGFGSFAYALSRRIEIERYDSVDHPAMQAVQKYFLNQSTPSLFVKFSDMTLADVGEVDLVLNTYSFGEMEPEQVDAYFAAFQPLVTVGGAFYTVNRLQRETPFNRYPYDGRWKHTREDIVSWSHAPFVECLSIRQP